MRSSTTWAVCFAEPGLLRLRDDFELRQEWIVAVVDAARLSRMAVGRVAVRRGFGRAVAVRAAAVFQELLDRFGGVLAAGGAEREILFLAGRDRFGVGLADVAAGAAIELGHRGHQPAFERFALGQSPIARRSSDSDRARGSFFRSLWAVRSAGSASSAAAGRLPFSRLAGVEADPAGEKAIEPRPLFGRERGRIRE